jgi:hypothetical protein
MHGRSVRLFLIDGTPQGMRTAEVGNWSGLALVCPRTDLARLGARPEVRRTGVYILVGPSETTASGVAVYVGEGDDVWARLTSHDDKKDFWTWVVLFVSKDDNLTKAHVRWLESTLAREIKNAKRAEITNGNEPPAGKLPEADTADMQTFFDNVRLLLPTLGINVFGVEALKKAEPQSDSVALVLELEWEGARAQCAVREAQFVVLAGSHARVKEVDSIGGWTRALRKTLRESGVLVPSDDAKLLRFTQEYVFDSPSGAAAVVAGSNVNGRLLWKVKGAGISYKEWQQQQVHDDAT